LHKGDRQARSQSRGGCNDVEREFRRKAGVIGTRARHARDRHVVVADRLDLFDPGILGQLVEFADLILTDPVKYGRLTVPSVRAGRKTRAIRFA
jgi:hypothetical protein